MTPPLTDSAARGLRELARKYDAHLSSDDIWQIYGAADRIEVLTEQRDALLAEFRDQLRWLDRGSERYLRVRALLAQAEATEHGR